MKKFILRMKKQMNKNLYKYKNNNLNILLINKNVKKSIENIKK